MFDSATRPVLPSVDSALTRRFYDALAKDYHRAVPDWSGALERHGAILDRVLRDRLGDRTLAIVDIACGIGTQTVGLATLGHRVLGLDVSVAALARAASIAVDYRVDVELREADMRAIPPEITSRDAVICCDNSLPHLLTEDDVIATFSASIRALSPGGMLVVSTRDYDRHLVVRPTCTMPAVTTTSTGQRITFQRWEWLDEQRYRVELFLLDQLDGRWDATTYNGATFRAWRRDELAALAERAGLVDVGWNECAETGFHQPIMTARRATRAG